MKKILRKLFLNNFKNIFYMFQNSNSKYFDYNKIEFVIKKDCCLGVKNTKIQTRIDQIITPNILKKGKWDYFIIKFICKYIKNKTNQFSFIDLGSNIGLITRQLYLKKPDIKNFHCIEPEKENYNILLNNLDSFKNVYTYNCALTNQESGIKKMYLNKNNFGDFSLLKNSNKTTTYINTLNASSFFNKIISKHKINKIIYKSDTQGFDEMIVLSLSKKILDKIDMMILEISNFYYLKKNILQFFALIENYNVKENDIGKKIDKEQIKKMISKEVEFNLLLYKD
ncbi:FkbM family methyltransferase [Candidatus Pelagibacter ubique]|jgi:FkbM family methyltransferase|nr:FkbM family methyltransferase [Candidatus Pelagibacter ubique]